jgi:hypothetical protein
MSAQNLILANHRVGLYDGSYCHRFMEMMIVNDHVMFLAFDFSLTIAKECIFQGFPW